MKNSQYVFFFLMAAASGLSVLKTGLLARILSADDFAVYAAVFASVSFVADMVSFGLTQGTFKRYPRYVAEQRYGDLVRDIRTTLRKLGVRHLAFGVVSVVVAEAFYGTRGALAALAVSFLALGINTASISGSLFRALDRLLALGASTFLRAAIAALCGIGFALMDGWTAAFLSESISNMLVGIALIATLYVQVNERHRTFGNGSTADPSISNPIDGVLLFVAFFILTLSTSLDRLFLIRLSDLGTASTYAFVGIWLTAAYTLGNIYVQKFGPDIITQLTLDPHARPLGRVRKNSAVLALLLGIGTAISMSSLYFVLYDSIWQKYGLSAGVVAIAVFAVALQVTPLFEWTLMALDAEKFVLYGAIVLLVVMVAMFLLAFWSSYGFFGYASAIIVGRATQLIFLDRAVASLQPKQAAALPRL